MYGISTCDYFESKYQECLTQLEQILAVESDPTTSTGVTFKFSVRNAKALTSRALGRFQDALETEEVLCQDASHELTEKHPTVLRFKSVLAGLYQRLLDFERAEETYSQVIAGREEVYGPLARNTLQSKRDLAAMKLGAGEYAAAKAQLEELLPIFLNELGTGDKSTADLYRKLSRACALTEELEKADEYAQKAIEIGVLTEGENHPNTLMARTDLAKIQGKLGRFTSALDLVDKAIRQYTSENGATDYFTLTGESK